MKSTLLGAAAALALATSANAATYSLVPTVAAYYTPADTSFLTPLPAPPNNAAAGVYQVNVGIDVGNTLPAGKSFGSVDFKFNLNGLLNTSVPGWQGDAGRQVDTNGNAPGGGKSLWDTNDTFAGGDIITGVSVGTALAAADPRLYVGQPDANQSAVRASDHLEDPTFMGTLYIDYNGSGQKTLTFTPVSFANRNNTTNAYEILTNGQGGNSFTAGSVQFGGVGTIPEPTSLAVLALGGLVAARRRRA